MRSRPHFPFLQSDSILILFVGFLDTKMRAMLTKIMSLLFLFFLVGCCCCRSACLSSKSVGMSEWRKCPRKKTTRLEKQERILEQCIKWYLRNENWEHTKRTDQHLMTHCGFGKMFTKEQRNDKQKQFMCFSIYEKMAWHFHVVNLHQLGRPYALIGWRGILLSLISNFTKPIANKLKKNHYSFNISI